MKAPATLALFALISALVFGGCGEDPPPSQPAESEPRPRNIFLIVIDTLRADYLGLYGHPRDTTPTLDRLGRAGIVFERAFATAPSTLESVASLLTGTAQLAPRWPIRSLPREVRPLQSLLKEAGYRTYGVVANPWLATRPRLFERDFDDHWSITDWKKVAGDTTRAATQVILDALDRHANQSKPGFFYLHYIDPHDPYRPPRRYGFYDGPLPFASIELHRASGEDAVRRKRDEYGYTGLPQPESLSAEQMRLLRAGMRPISNIVDITNYVMLELGQPLHAFDYHVLRPKPGDDKPAIIVRRAHDGEQMETLDGELRTFDEEVLLITDGSGPVALAGVLWERLANRCDLLASMRVTLYGRAR